MTNIPKIQPNSEDIYAQAKSERQKHVDAILNSPSRKKIVVAGPGTGKTYLFKEITLRTFHTSF